MKSASLKNKILEVELSQNGFLLIKNFLNPNEVNKIFELYKTHHPQSDTDTGMWNSLYNAGTENGLEISRLVLEILKPRLDAVFDSYYAPVATFMSKNANPNSSCDLHRDYTTADETLYQYRNIWIPLVDTTMDNGTLYVVRGSNRIFDYTLPMFCEWPYKSLHHELLELTETIECNAGDMVVYLDKTLHGSHINRSNDSRPVIHFGALHPDVRLLFHFLDRNTNMVKAYEVPFQFFFENDFSEPIGRFPLYSEFEYAPPILSISDIKQRLSL
jgi:hypothetical protein